MKRFFWGAMFALAASPLLAIQACSSDAAAPTTATDAGSTPDAAPDSPANEASTDTVTVPEGLVIDGITCTEAHVDAPVFVEATWEYRFKATCGGLGVVNLTVGSHTEFPYPQSCGVATTVSLFIPNTGDSGPFIAGVAGACQIVTGPYLVDEPPTALVLAATAPGQQDPNVVHRITIRIPAPARPACADVTAPQRASAVACPTTRPAGDSEAHTGDTCTTDAECTSGTNGRCTVDPLAMFSGGTVHRVCTYDACHQDSDCPSGPCQCGRSAEQGNGANICLTNSDCKVDSDCASGKCALSSPYPTGAHEGTTGSEIYLPGMNRSNTEAHGYFCATPKDNCCSVGSGSCTYDWTHKRWAWGYGP